MSEFKFACPVCGQHITADSSSSGSQLECPTCFQKIIVPQAPASGESKFILSAAQVAKPRPTSTDLGGLEPVKPSSGSKLLTILFIVIVCLGAGAAVLFRDRLLKIVGNNQTAPTNAPSKQRAKPAPRVVYPVPTNILWTLDLTNAVFPDANAAGNIHGLGFQCERATLTESNLWLRQGKDRVADLGINIQFFSADLGGKTIEISPDRDPPMPKVSLRWKNDQQQLDREDVQDGYALRIVFGQSANGHLPGQLYVCLPDKAKSFVAGSFNASIQKPRPPGKKGKPKQQK